MAQADEEEFPTEESEAQHDASVSERRRRIEAMFAGKPVSAPTIVPGGYPVALLERVEDGDEDALDKLGLFLHKGATELMRRGRGGMMCTAYVFCRHCPMGGRTPDPLYTTALTTPEAHDYRAFPVKDMLTELVHGIAMIGAARAVAFISEAWRVSRKPGEKIPKNVDFGTIPGREECVLVSVETKAFTRAWSGKIVRYGGRGLVIEPFEKSLPGLKGRFFGVMQPGFDPRRAAHPKEAEETPPTVDSVRAEEKATGQ